MGKTGRGVHEHYDLESLLAYFAPHKERYATATPLFKVHYQNLGPLIRETGVTAYLDGHTKIGDALARDPHPPGVAQALYVFLVTGMIRAVVDPGPAVAIPDKGAAVAPKAELDPDELAKHVKINDEIAREYLRLKNADFFDALRVEMTASTDEVDLAHDNIVQSLGLRSLPAQLSNEARHRAAEVQAMLDQAKEILRDPQTRDQYLHAEQDRFAPVGDTTAASQQAEGPPTAVTSLELDIKSGLAGQRAFSAGEALMRAGRYVDAAREYQAAIDACATEPDYRMALGVAILKAEGLTSELARSRVVTCLEQALQLDPGHVGANLEMAKLLHKTGANDRATAYLQRVLQRAPESQEARRLLADL